MSNINAGAAGPSGAGSSGTGPGASGNGQPRLHISHRKSPSEYTPLVLEQLQLQQQIQMLQQQNELLQAQQQQYHQAGLMQPPSFVPPMGQQPAYSFPAQQPGMHRRGPSAAGQNMGPPPAPSSGAGYEQYNSPGQRRGGGGAAAAGHARRHSLALHEARSAAAQAQAMRPQSPNVSGAGTGAGTATPPQATGNGTNVSESQTPPRRVGHGRSQSLAGNTRTQNPQISSSPSRGGFQFPSPGDGANVERRSSGGASGYSHSRSGSRNFDSNWRSSGNQQQQQFDTPPASSFTPGHRSRPSMGSSISSMSAFQFPAGQPMMFGQQSLLSPQLLQQQQLQQMQAQGGQQRKSLFAPYLPQATLPALLAEGRLVSGVLRVNKKNRSDAYVSTEATEADVFICGSKDRNRALEGDLVAVELLDVDEVWGAKREKEEKKKRKDGDEPGLQRRGSLKQRPVQKKNDDVEVEGQGLLLVEEEELSDEMKPMYAGHIVAVIERTLGQLFSGTLGLLRPSSAATKEKQDAERRERDGGRSNVERHTERPKIVWFKPTDKRVPLIAIPTEQAPRDFVENHQAYAKRIFVASIKRWPITSLHPFGTLVEELGEMGSLQTETEALLRDNNFTGDEFTESLIKTVPDFEISETERSRRRDFTEENVFTVFPDGSQEFENALHVKRIDESSVEIGFHVADVSYFVKPNSILDKEAKKRGTNVYLVQRAVSMLPAKLGADICSLVQGAERFTFSIILHVEASSGAIKNTWIGRGLVKSRHQLSYENMRRIMEGNNSSEYDEWMRNDVALLMDISTKFRSQRFNGMNVPQHSLRLLAQLDDENVPVSVNIFEAKAGHLMVEEFQIRANALVAEKIVKAFPSRAITRRHAPPVQRRLDVFAQRINARGYAMDVSSSATLQKSICDIPDADIRKGLETLLIKTVNRAKYTVASVGEGDHQSHYILNLPLYTHFTNPVRRYADIIVHRQLEAALAGEDYYEDLEGLIKTAESCNNHKDSAKQAQDQSVHLFICSAINKMSSETGMLIRDAVVINVHESAFDVLIPEFGVEKRVHCDQLCLQKAEFDKNKRVLELYWEKGVDPATYVPEDERGNTSVARRPRASSRAAAMAQEQDDHKGLMDMANMNISKAQEALQEMTLAEHSRSVPQSPTPKAIADSNGPNRTSSDSVVATIGGTERNPLAGYLEGLTYYEKNGEYIQEIRELAHVPVLLRSEISKSPPCLTVLTLNPFAA